jgi:hypothetical protein
MSVEATSNGQYVAREANHQTFNTRHEAEYANSRAQTAQQNEAIEAARANGGRGSSHPSPEALVGRACWQNPKMCCLFFVIVIIVISGGAIFKKHG